VRAKEKRIKPEERGKKKPAEDSKLQQNFLAELAGLGAAVILSEASEHIEAAGMGAPGERDGVAIDPREALSPRGKLIPR
jgi:hypothetical protein